MQFVFSVPQKVPGESTYSGSVIARESFTINVLAIDDYGDPTNYNGTVPVYANSPTSDTAYQIGTVTFSSGRGTSTNLTITSVFNNGASRIITVSDGRVKSSREVGVWFKGDATYFNTNGTYCEGIGKGKSPKYSVALPVYQLCEKQVKVYNPNTNRTLSGQVWDVGPFFDKNACGEDRYWETGTVPRAITYKNKKVCEVCNVPCDQYTRTINGAIIDLSPDLMRDLGGSGTITNALWRFE